MSVASGCARRPPEPPPPPVPVPFEETAKLYRRLAEEARRVARYQSVVRIRGRGPEGRFRATLVVVFERPDRIRVEHLGAFGATRWMTVAGGDEIRVLFPGPKEYLIDSAVEEVVGALLGLRLAPEEVIAILAGSGVPLSEREPTAGRRLGPRLHVDLATGGDLIIEGGQIRRARTGSHRVRYPTSWKDDGGAVPDRIEVEGDGIEATLEIEDIDVNVRLDPNIFIVELPEDGVRLGLAQIGDEAVFVKPRQ